MPKFRKLPVVIEAVQLKPGFELPEWLLDAIAEMRVHISEAHFIIKTPEGPHLGNQGDWIIRGIHGELYPCKDEIFRKTYEPA